MSNGGQNKLQFKNSKSIDEILEVINEQPSRKTFYHYTTLSNLINMRKSNKIELTRGDSQRLNDQLEKFKCDRTAWKNIYIACFTYELDESVALWECFDNPMFEALRLRVKYNDIRQIINEGKKIQIYQVNIGETNDANRYKKMEEYQFCSIQFTGITYWNPEKETLLFKGQLLKSSEESPFIANIYTEEKMAGRLKNISWKHEKEYRIIAILSNKSQEENPEKIAIDAKGLWEHCNILCGPCLEPMCVEEKLSQHKNIKQYIKQSAVFKMVNLTKECVYCKSKNHQCASTRNKDN